MTRPANVLVAVVEVAVKCDATTSPTTESFVYGEVVPIPTLPLERMVIFAVSEGPIMRELAVVLMTDLPIATAPEALDVFPDPKATAPAPLAVLIYPIATEPTVPEEMLLYPVATVRIPEEVLPEPIVKPEPVFVLEGPKLVPAFETTASPPI